MKPSLMSLMALTLSITLGLMGCVSHSAEVSPELTITKTQPETAKTEPEMAKKAIVGDTTIVLVRHAEKGEGMDPPLTEAGKKRAEALVQVLRSADVKAVYLSQAKRSRETVAPISAATGLKETVVPIGRKVEDHVATIVKGIREEHAGECVLVVGHSNTLPMILKELGVKDLPTIAESEYDRLFIVVLRKDGGVKMIEAKFGA